MKNPQNNGMTEAFVKAFKRGHVYLNDLPDAQTVMAKLPAPQDYHSHGLPQLSTGRSFLKARVTFRGNLQ